MKPSRLSNSDRDARVVGNRAWSFCIYNVLDSRMPSKWPRCVHHQQGEPMDRPLLASMQLPLPEPTHLDPMRHSDSKFLLPHLALTLYHSFYLLLMHLSSSDSMVGHFSLATQSAISPNKPSFPIVDWNAIEYNRRHRRTVEAAQQAGK